MDADATCGTARVLAAEGRRAEALAQVNALLAVQPAYLPALLLRGELAEGGREPAVALHAYEHAASVAPESAAAWNGQARQLRALGRGAEAFMAAQHARTLLAHGDNFVQTGPVYLTLVFCLRDERRYREALALAEEGLERTSDAVLAEWATQIEQEWAAADKERC